MTTLEALRAGNRRLIAESPVEVLIRRTEFSSAESGGRTQKETVLPAFAGRLVPPRRAVYDRRNEAGGMKLAFWTLIAPWNADLRAGSDVLDVFVAQGKTYRVAQVVPRFYEDEAFAIHANCEELS